MKKGGKICVAGACNGEAEHQLLFLSSHKKLACKNINRVDSTRPDSECSERLDDFCFACLDFSTRAAE